MDTYKRNEILRITELLNLKNVEVTPTNHRCADECYSPINSALSASTIGYFEWNVDLNYVYGTEIIYKFAGLSPGNKYSYYDLLCKVFDEDSIYRHLKTLESVYTGDESEAVIELPYFSDIDQSIHETKIVFVNLKMRGDSKFIIAGTVQEMTEFNRSRNELEESRNLLNQLINAIPMPILYVNDQSKIEFANKAVADVFEVSSDKLIDLNYSEYVVFMDELLGVTNKTKITQENEHSSYEISAVKNGEQFEILLESVNIFDKIGNIVGRVLIHSDITNRIKDLEKVKKY